MQSTKEKTPTLSKETQERMQAYRELGTPGQQHRYLARMAGKWSTLTRAWAEPDTPPVESPGMAEAEMIFDGRYLRQMHTGQMMGTPYIGMAISGYDNNTKKYFTAWMDSTSTSLTVYEGNASPDGKTMMLDNRMNDPVLGPMTTRAITRITDDDHYLFEMYGIYKDGTQQKMMEIHYTRAK